MKRGKETADLPGGRLGRPWLLVGLACLTATTVAIALVMALGKHGKLAEDFHGVRYDPPRPAPDFSFVDQERQSVRLSDYRGDLVLLFFGFLNCPSACPVTLSTWEKVRDGLGDRAERVHFVFITVDPERDTPERIKRHLGLFDPAFVGLRGSLEDTEDVAREFNVFMEKTETASSIGYLVNHTTLTFVIDQTGNLALAFPLDTTAQEVVSDLQRLLADSPRPAN